MPILDFKEIPQANLSSGEQDTFELFTREFLEFIGFKILHGPDRGSDRGRDLLVEEVRVGITGESVVRWLVSCKHKAHSGQAVNLTDEQNILERVKAHQCNGFLGVYSTLPSSTLNDTLYGVKKSDPSFEVFIFDKENIERALLSRFAGKEIALRYFPESLKNWDVDNLEISIAFARFGMPQPIQFKYPNENKFISLDELLKIHSEGNQYYFDPFSGSFIFYNNILGITQIIRGGKSFEASKDELEYMKERRQQYFKYLIDKKNQSLTDSSKQEKNREERKRKIRKPMNNKNRKRI